MRVSRINITVADDGSMEACVGFVFADTGNGVAHKFTVHPHDSIAMILRRAAKGIGAGFADDAEAAIQRASAPPAPDDVPGRLTTVAAPSAGPLERMRGFFRRGGKPQTK